MTLPAAPGLLIAGLLMCILGYVVARTMGSESIESDFLDRLLGLSIVGIYLGGGLTELGSLSWVLQAWKINSQPPALLIVVSIVGIIAAFTIANKTASIMDSQLIGCEFTHFAWAVIGFFVLLLIGSILYTPLWAIATIVRPLIPFL